jgi:large subunit ribosomal protein L17
MRHCKNTVKLGKSVTHRRAMMANMLKSLISNGRIETTVPKAKELRRHADHLITLAKRDNLTSKRLAISALRVTFNPLSSKEARFVKKDGNLKFYNTDRLVIKKLFGELKDRFMQRNGGYTRIIKKECRIGDNAQKCYIEYI